jgi:hypothetical protein
MICKLMVDISDGKNSSETLTFQTHENSVIIHVRSTIWLFYFEVKMLD